MAGESRTGGRILVDQLRLHGVDTVFGVPGESYLEVLDALHDTPEIRFVDLPPGGRRGDDGRRPGASSPAGPASPWSRAARARPTPAAGVHVAQQDSVPMILFVGQIDRAQPRARRVPGGRLPPDVRRHGQVGGRDRRRRRGSPSSSIAPSPRPPPAGRARWCWRCPRTCWSRPPSVADGRPAGAGRARRPHRRRWPSCAGCSSTAERPFVILGGGGWNASGVARLRALPRGATSCRRPAASAARTCSTTSIRCYAGHIGLGPNPKLVARIKAADLVLAIGARLGETTSQGFTLLDVPRPAPEPRPCPQRSRGAGPGLPGRPADPVRPRRVRRRPRPRCRRAARRPWAEATAARACRGARLARARPGSRASCSLGEVVAWLRERLPAETRSSPTAPATTRSGPTAISAIAASGRSWPRPPARWATACRPPSPPSSLTPSGRWSASPATAAS